MKRTSFVLLLTVVLSGCGGCEPGQPQAGGSAAAPAGGGAATSAGGKIEAGGGVVPTVGRPPAPARPTAAAAPAAAAPPAGAAEQAADEDCVVVADANPDFGPPPLTVSFTAEAECHSGTPSYKWTFGDDSPPSTEANPSHTYKKEGDFTATVTVTAPNGTTSTDEVDIFVEEE